jgi:hypothetical protein
MKVGTRVTVLPAARDSFSPISATTMPATHPPDGNAQSVPSAMATKTGEWPRCCGICHPAGVEVPPLLQGPVNRGPDQVTAQFVNDGLFRCEPNQMQAMTAHTHKVKILSIILTYFSFVIASPLCSLCAAPTD